MPLTIKQNGFKFKDSNDDYVGVDVIAETTLTEQIAAVEGEGATQVAAVQAKGTEVIASIPADYTELTEEVDDLKSALNANKTVTPGYIFTATNEGDGTTWSPVGTPTDAQTAAAVSDWLDDHPEATTTVQDGSLTESKFSSALKLKTIKEYVTPEMFGAVGDGNTDDSNAIQSALDQHKPVVFFNRYLAHNINVSGNSELLCLGSFMPYYYGEDNSVFKNMFSFTNADEVVINGFRVEGKTYTSSETHTYDTESVLQFTNCNNVIINNAAFLDLNVSNKSGTAHTIFERKGVCITSINSNVRLENSTIDNVIGDELTWFCISSYDSITNDYVVNNCTFRNITNKSIINMTGRNGTVKDCVFENCSYAGSVMNVVCLYINISNNIVKNASGECFIDTTESSIGVNTECVISNNCTDNSCSFDYFAITCGGKCKIINNIVHGVRSFIFQQMVNTSNAKIYEILKNEEMIVYGNNVYILHQSVQEFSASTATININRNDSVCILGNNFECPTSGAKNTSITVTGCKKINIANNIIPIRHYSRSQSNVYCAIMIVQDANSSGVVNNISILNNIFNYLEYPSGSTIYGVIFVSTNASNVYTKAAFNSLIGTENMITLMPSDSPVASAIKMYNLSFNDNQTT